MQVYYESDFGESKIILMEPYEYTFKELIQMGTINLSNSAIILKKLGNVV